MNYRWILIGSVLLLLSLTNVQPIGATRVPKLGIDELLTQSALVFVGTVSAMDFGCHSKGHPCTQVTFVDIEVIVGVFQEKELSFFLPEGPLGDGTSIKIAGAPIFERGERYLLFVRGGDWHMT